MKAGEIFNFWSADWSKRITVEWDYSISFPLILKYAEKVLGEDMGYERAISCNLTHTITAHGLAPIK